MSVSSWLSVSEQGFDVLVIGGGINGVAIARECAKKRRRVLLIEQHDFASGTDIALAVDAPQIASLAVAPDGATLWLSLRHTVSRRRVITNFGARR